MATSNQLVLPLFGHSYLSLVNVKKFLGFCQDIDNANAQNGIVDPPAMNKVWFRTVVQKLRSGMDIAAWKAVFCLYMKRNKNTLAHSSR